MKQTLSGIVLLLLACSSAHAVLVSRSGGLAYYDTATDLTWVADANPAQTSGYDADGLMNWSTAVAWTASLNAQNARLGYLGVNNWRLPTTAQPDATCDLQLNPGGSFPLQGAGISCTGSEMGYLFNVDGITSASPTPFANVQPNYYWSGTAVAPATSNAWIFVFNGGFQDFDYKTDGFYAWAVRPEVTARVNKAQKL